MILTATWHQAGCTPFSLPAVPEDAVRSVEGDQVKIVERVRLSNPTDEWIYTYLMLEVAGEEPYLTTVVSTLAKNGWEVHHSSIPDMLPAAVLAHAAYLSLVEFDDYMYEGRSWAPARKEFGRVPTSDGRGTLWRF
jgi:hypothetical protein